MSGTKVITQVQSLVIPTTDDHAAAIMSHSVVAAPGADLDRSHYYLAQVHRPSGLHTHFRSKLGHEEEILVTKNYFVVDRNMIKFGSRCL